jgi:hypothetical protein
MNSKPRLRPSDSTQAGRSRCRATTRYVMSCPGTCRGSLVVATRLSWVWTGTLEIRPCRGQAVHFHSNAMDKGIVDIAVAVALGAPIGRGEWFRIIRQKDRRGTISTGSSERTRCQGRPTSSSPPTAPLRSQQAFPAPGIDSSSAARSFS